MIGDCSGKCLPTAVRFAASAGTGLEHSRAREQRGESASTHGILCLARAVGVAVPPGDGTRFRQVRRSPSRCTYSSSFDDGSLWSDDDPHAAVNDPAKHPDDPNPARAHDSLQAHAALVADRRLGADHAPRSHGNRASSPFGVVEAGNVRDGKGLRAREGRNAAGGAQDGHQGSERQRVAGGRGAGASPGQMRAGRVAQTARPTCGAGSRRAGSGTGSPDARRSVVLDNSLLPVPFGGGGGRRRCSGRSVRVPEARRENRYLSPTLRRSSAASACPGISGS